MKTFFHFIAEMFAAGSFVAAIVLCTLALLGSVQACEDDCYNKSRDREQTIGYDVPQIIGEHRTVCHLVLEPTKEEPTRAQVVCE